MAKSIEINVADFLNFLLVINFEKRREKSWYRYYR